MPGAIIPTGIKPTADKSLPNTAARPAPLIKILSQPEQNGPCRLASHRIPCSRLLPTKTGFPHFTFSAHIPDCHIILHFRQQDMAL
jgi:hypothetical protein